MSAPLRLLLCVLTVTACGPAVSHGGPVRDHVSFVDNLRARGFTVEPIGQTKVVPLDVPATGLAVSGGALSGRAAMLSFGYDDTDLGRDGQRAGPSHFYRRERVIVMYVGADPEMLSVLVDLLGPQFAGARQKYALTRIFL